MVFSKKFCGCCGIDLFVSSDTYKGKVAYVSEITLGGVVVFVGKG